MEYVYAAMLLHKAGQDVDEEGVTNVLEAAGIEPDASRVKALISSLEDVDIDEAVENAAVAQTSPAPSDEPTETDESEDDEQEQEEDEDGDEDEGASDEEAAEGLGALFDE